MCIYHNDVAGPLNKPNTFRNSTLLGVGILQSTCLPKGSVWLELLWLLKVNSEDQRLQTIKKIDRRWTKYDIIFQLPIRETKPLSK
jgi:hypothetical protein